MDDATLAASLEALFVPWCHADGSLLGGKVLYPCRMLPRERTLWAIWYVPYDDPGAARACLECVQLLNLVAQIDGAVYERLLNEIFSELPITIATYPECLNWRLGLQIQVDAGTDFAFLSDCFVRVDQLPASSPLPQNRAFVDAWNILQCHIDTADARAVRGATPLWLSVWPDPDDDDGLADALVRVRDIARDFAAGSERLRAIRLTDCCVELPYGPSITALLGLVIEIMQRGVRISWLAFSPELDPEPLGPTALTQAIHLLLFPRVVDDNGVASMALHTDVEGSILAPLCSALMHTPSVRQIVLDTLLAGSARADNDRSSWRWLALALFSSRARNAIERLEINLTGLSSEDVSTIAAVVGADDPIAATIYPGPAHPRVVSQQVARLAPGCQLWLAQPAFNDPLSQLPNGDFRIHEELGAVTVIDAPNVDSPCLHVLMPGLGPCWVLREGALCEETEPAHGGRQIDHLVLTGITQQSAGPTLGFLQLIAHGTKTLEVRNVGSDVLAFPTWRAQCISACPMLQAFISDSHHSESVDAILEAVSGAHPSCPIDTLRLEGIYSPADFAGLHRFTLALADRRHPIASQLRHLTISGSEMTMQHTVTLWIDLVDALLDVLDRNKQLVSCRVQIPSSIRLCDSYRREFDSFNGELLPLRAGPLVLSCKLAFISVGIPGSRDCLTNDALTHVFEFAADCVRRVWVLA